MTNYTGAGIRKKRNRAPMSSSAGDSTKLRYSCMGRTIATDTTLGGTVEQRYYVPGYNGNVLANTNGPVLASYYSTGKFLPGTRIRWEPSVSFTTSGRVLCGFTDNPEAAATIQGLIDTYTSSRTGPNLAAVSNAVRGLGSVFSFPVWQETEVQFPTKLRRKRFDCNGSLTATADILDRSMQTAMFVVVEGGPTTATTLGGFWYHDFLDVEGIHPTIT